MHAEQLSAENKREESKKTHMCCSQKNNIVIQFTNRRIQTEGPASTKSELLMLHVCIKISSSVLQTLLYKCVYKINIQMRAEVKDGY